MKCEICHKAPAQTVIRCAEDGDDELYVCSACAEAERVRRQKMSQRTRKATLTISSDDPHMKEELEPLARALMNAVDSFVNDISKHSEMPKDKSAEKDDQLAYPLDSVDKCLRFDFGLHLEGLSLTGDLDCILRAAHALDVDMQAIEADGVSAAAHVFMLKAHKANFKIAESFLKHVAEEERKARVRLLDEMPRVFGDAVCRSLALLKNCRMVSPVELFDMLSPIRLAMLEGLIDGMTLRKLERLASEMLKDASYMQLSRQERDDSDAARADRVNRLFADVMLNERGEERNL